MHAWHNGDSIDLVHFDPAHTDTDIYIYFHKADVLHVGDIWFNGMYPFIDEGTGGSIGGMIHASRRPLPSRTAAQRSFPAWPPGIKSRASRSFDDMLSSFATRSAALKARSQ